MIAALSKWRHLVQGRLFKIRGIGHISRPGVCLKTDYPVIRRDIEFKRNTCRTAQAFFGIPHHHRIMAVLHRNPDGFIKSQISEMDTIKKQIHSKSYTQSFVRTINMDYTVSGKLNGIPAFPAWTGVWKILNFTAEWTLYSVE